MNHINRIPNDVLFYICDLINDYYVVYYLSSTCKEMYLILKPYFDKRRPTKIIRKKGWCYQIITEDGPVKYGRSFEVFYKWMYCRRYIRGILHGKSIVYHQYDVNTRYKYEMNYFDGLQHGIQKEYYSNGKLKKMEEYENGIESGILKEWDINGNLVNSEYIVPIGNISQQWNGYRNKMILEML
jgi:hypothetical protein